MPLFRKIQEIIITKDSRTQSKSNRFTWKLKVPYYMYPKLSLSLSWLSMIVVVAIDQNSLNIIELLV